MGDCFWTDLTRADQPDCGGAPAVDYWCIAPTNDQSTGLGPIQFNAPTASAQSVGEDVLAGDILTIVGVPQAFVLGDSNSGCGLPGCGTYPSVRDPNVTIPGSLGVVPPSPWCPDGGILVVDPGIPWTYLPGVAGAHVSVGDVGHMDVDYFTLNGTNDDFFAAALGDFGTASQIVMFVTLHNDRSGKAYGVLCSYHCWCY